MIQKIILLVLSNLIMKNTTLSKFEIFVDGKLRFIKNNLREKNNIITLLQQKGINNVHVNEIKFY